MRVGTPSTSMRAGEKEGQVEEGEMVQNLLLPDNSSAVQQNWCTRD